MNIDFDLVLMLKKGVTAINGGREGGGKDACDRSVMQVSLCCGICIEYLQMQEILCRVLLR